MAGKIVKVSAYITNGRRLLVFRHAAFPDAGIQVPSGTVDAGETPRTAVLREAREETGLHDLSILTYLGVTHRDQAEFGRSGIEERHYFHLLCTETTPKRWRHWERYPSEGPQQPIEFELYWVSWPHDLPPLAGGQDALLASIDWNSLSS